MIINLLEHIEKLIIEGVENQKITEFNILSTERE